MEQVEGRHAAGGVHLAGPPGTRPDAGRRPGRGVEQGRAVRAGPVASPVEGVGAGHHPLGVVVAGELRQPRLGEFDRGRAHGLRRPGPERTGRDAPAGDGLEDPRRSRGQAAPRRLEIGPGGLARMRGHHGSRPDRHRRDGHHPRRVLLAPDQREFAETGHGGVEDGLVVVDTQSPRHRAEPYGPGIGTDRGGCGRHEQLRPRQRPHRPRGGRRQAQARGQHVQRGGRGSGHVRAQLAHAHEGVVGQPGEPGGEVRRVGGGAAGGGSGARHDPSQPSETAAAVRTGPRGNRPTCCRIGSEVRDYRGGCQEESDL